MAAFATMIAAEARAVAKQSGTGDNTWIVAHSCRTLTGAIAVRVQRKMSPTNPGHGGWVEITDDGTV